MTRNAAQQRTTLSAPSRGNILTARAAITPRTSLPTNVSKPASSTESLIMTLPSSVWRMVWTTEGMNGAIFSVIMICRAAAASVDCSVLGSDYSVPPADLDPIGTVRKAGFAEKDVAKILDENALTLMPRLRAR